MRPDVKSELCVRAMCRQDVAEVVKIEHRVSPFPWTDRMFVDCLSADYDCSVLLLNKLLIGYVALLCNKPEIQLMNLGIALDQQCKGFGRYLLGNRIEQAKENGFEKIILESRRSNHVALGLYERLDFQYIGERKNYYRRQRACEDAVVMELRFQPSIEAGDLRVGDYKLLAGS